MLELKDSNIREVINGSGIVTSLKLEKQELNFLQSLVQKHAISNVKAYSTDLYHSFSKLMPYEWHKLATESNHKDLWTKKNRIFPTAYCEEIKKLPFYKKLEGFFGTFSISNEEQLYAEEMYWRIVRPNKKQDIGPIHADKWFWDLGYGVMPENHFRVKVWICLWCDKGNNGLKVVPYSHNTDYEYSSSVRDGSIKPDFDHASYDLEILELDNEPGDCVIFNDKTLHGGCFNTGTNSRVSMEFTMLIPNSKILNL